MVRAANQVNRRHIPCYCYHPTRSYIISCQQILKLRHHRTVFLLPHTRARTEAFLLGHRHPTPPPPHTFLSFLSQIFREPLTPTNHYHQRTYISNSYSSPQASPNHANIILIYLFLYRRVFSDHTSSWRAALPASLLTARPSSSLLLLVILLPPPPPPMSTFWHSTHKLT